MKTEKAAQTMKTRFKVTPLITLFVVFFLSLLSHTTWSYYAEPETEFELLRTVKGHIKSNYVEKDVDDTQLEYGAIKGLLKSLDDPYTRFIPPKNFKEMKVRLEGEFFGIGIHIGIRKDRLTVISPILGTPADEAGLESLDKIMTINGEKTDGLSLEEAVSKIRGERGSTVVLGIQRLPKKEIFDVPIIRDKITIKAVDKVEVFKSNVGYIRLSTFESQKASREFANALSDLKKKKVTSLVIDLRFNGGGLLRNAISIANMLIREGDIVHTIDRNGNKKTESVFGRPLFGYRKIVVLVNQGSASASEILAGAIKDNKRGVILGKDTFGKASVQNILRLKDGSAVLYTIAKYYTPLMTDINKTGISVDIELDLPTENIALLKDPEYVYSYETDYQLQEGIKILLSDTTVDNVQQRYPRETETKEDEGSSKTKEAKEKEKK